MFEINAIDFLKDGAVFSDEELSCSDGVPPESRPENINMKWSRNKT